MLKEDELAARLEDPAYTLNRLHHARNVHNVRVLTTILAQREMEKRRSPLV